ncbi:hypothetical protein [uncultured Tateyamaria sp.]|uniref:hypothetical protein n=1 Tax=uncultured Tateyamaria sp. TaxID=455651 RepID=UPI002620082E|nr:hypothetical protein [uncultured Tateyamaria sp.]
MTDSSLGHRSNRGENLFNGMTKPKKAKVGKTEALPPIHVGEHGRYQIKSGLLAGKFVARAFAKPPTEARGVIAEASGATEEAAIIALHDVIDERENRRIEARRKDPRTGISVPSIEEYAEALGHAALTSPQRAMLTALSIADADGLTDEQLAKAAGYKSHTSANRSLANAGRLFSDYFALETDSKVTSVALESSSLLAFRGEPHDETDSGNWILYPELRDAVRATL